MFVGLLRIQEGFPEVGLTYDMVAFMQGGIGQIASVDIS